MVKYRFDKFIGIDWSGDKNKFQKGISVALCIKGNSPPKLIKPKEKYWSRTSLLSWIKKITKEGNVLLGFDFSFAYPFHDKLSYFPGLKNIPSTPKSLWKLIDNINKNFNNFYGGGIWEKNPYASYYNSHLSKGINYQSRKRITEVYARNKFYAPSPTFNCVGPGSVGTGSLAGMRFLNYLENEISIWPFANINFKEQINYCRISSNFWF